MIRLYKTGNSICDIASALHIDHRTVRRYLDKDGLIEHKIHVYIPPSDAKMNDAIKGYEIALLRRQLKVGDEVPVMHEEQDLDRGAWRPSVKIAYRYVVSLPAGKGMIVHVGKIKDKATEQVTYTDILLAMRRRDS